MNMGKKRKRPIKDAIQPRETRLCTRTSHGATARHSHPVISLYYPRVLTLRQYLLQQIPASSKSRRRRIAFVRADQPETRDLANLLDRTLVGVSKEHPPTSPDQHELARYSQSQFKSQFEDTDIGPLSAQAEIVDFVISALFNRSSFSSGPQHLLTHGFQRACGPHPPRRQNGTPACSIPGITALYHNENVDALKRSPWTEVLGLLGRNGDEIMLRLLFDCGVFTAIDEKEGVYYQISGLPLSVLDPIPQNVPRGETGPNPKTLGPAPSVPAGATITATAKNSLSSPRDAPHRPNNIVFFRRRMLYARPVVNSKGDVQFGLTSHHVLNRCPSSTVHILKYIFPRQFGLHNVFTSVPNSRETTLPVKDYFSREDEITNAERLRGQKIPKRLRGGVMELVQRLQNRHKHCSYGELLKYYCPPDSCGPWKLGAVDSQSEGGDPPSASEPIVTQVKPSDGTSSSSEAKEGRLQQEVPTPDVANGPTLPSSKGKMSLTEYATPPSSVSAFCRAVLRKLIPPQFYGTGPHRHANQKIFMKHVDRFVHMRRFESVSIHEVCQGIQITCMPWLVPPGVASQHSSASTKLSMTDLQKRTELFHEAIYYIFDSILIPLIRTNFYVTDSQTHRNRIFYFRHDVWKHLTQQPLSNLKSTIFEELQVDKAKDILHQRTLGYGSLRLLPKTTGIRPILNLRRRVILKSKWAGGRQFLGPSVNSTVAPIYNALNYERLHNPAQMGSCVSSMGDIQARLKEFKHRLSSGNGSGGPFYFVKLDIQSCFDTIPQQKLVRFIETLVTEDAYNMTKHVEMRPPNEFGGPWSANQQRKAIRKFVGRAVPTGKSESLPEVIAAGTSRRRNTVFVDTPTLKQHAAEDLLDLLNEHISNNLVRFGKEYFRQRNGIPQGSVLSSILCNLFYAEMEREVLDFLPDKALLLRLVDDFLLITPNPQLARHFLEVMIQGQPAYGISVNPTKSLVNFAASVDGTQMPRLLDTHLFPYCGTLIDTRTLEIHKDHDRILEGGGAASAAATLSDLLTVEGSRAPGRCFHRKILSSFMLLMHPMFFDTTHNSLPVTLSNIYANFLITAMKAYRYLRSLQGRTHPTADTIVRTIRDLTRVTQRLVRRGQERRARAEGAESPAAASADVHPTQIEYLAAMAFRFVLGRKQTRYVEVLRWLAVVARQARPESERKRMQLAQVVSHGNGVYGGWKF